MLPVLRILFALFRAGTPLPDLGDRTAVSVWWHSLEVAAPDLIVALHEAIAHPKVGAVDFAALTEAHPDVQALAAEAPEANGELLKKFLALVIQYGPQLIPLIMLFFGPKPPQPAA